MIGKRIFFGLGMLMIGVLGIVPLFVIGEGTGNGLAAYAADTLLFALAAYGISRADPGAWLLYAILVCAPVFILSTGSGSSALLSVLMTAVTVGAAFVAWTNATKEPAAPPQVPGEDHSPQG